MGSDYWGAYVGGEKIKTGGLKDTTKLMSLPINDLPYGILYLQNKMR